MYVIVRTDITPSQQLVQSAHAVLESANKFSISSWQQHPHLVVCGVSCISLLLEASARLADANVPHIVWHEPDMNDQSTALATAPISGETRRFFRKYQCLRLA